MSQDTKDRTPRTIRSFLKTADGRKPIPEQLAIKEGDKVTVLQDDGTFRYLEARSSPWQLKHGEWVVLLTGISGGYLLSRVTPGHRQ